MGSTNYRGFNKMMPNPDEDHMDHANQTMAETLSMKVGQLKSLAIDLDGETRDHLPLLDGVGDDMDSTSHRMGGSSGRLRNMNRNRGLAGKKLTLCVGFSVTVLLFFLYYLMSRSPSSD
ncbi:unnamed protein product [Allacma fusca]|uniref:t-SNARE coiled-coil homology domain-containing protein n=1 Tax=Allacma fusca TaxID=39272 RepID=A0A8J2PQ91_9HEXA|nr:unnamed protein product [Allacma fusca]